MGKRASRLDFPAALFCDASYLIAWFATEDQYHPRALKIGSRLKGKSIKLVTSWPTISESSTLLLYHYGYSHAAALLDSLSAFELITPLESEYDETSALFKNRNRDQKLSFNDLLSSVLIRSRLKNIPALSFDKDFAKIGLTIWN